MNLQGMSHQGAFTKIAVLKGKQIRKVIHNNEWCFSVVDIISALTDSENPRDYWYKMKIREKVDSSINARTYATIPG